MLPLDDDHRALADAAAAFARRAAPLAATREQFADHGAGARPGFWPALLRQGLHSLHLPERYGGGGAGLAELAVVVEQFGRHLFPGPYLPTVLASAVVASLPDERLVDDLLAAFADGATGALVTGDGLAATREGDGWVVDGVSAPVLGLPGRRRRHRPRSGDGDGELSLWFRLTAAPPATVRSMTASTSTRSVGRLDAHRSPGRAGRRPAAAPDADLVDLLVNSLVRGGGQRDRGLVPGDRGGLRARDQFGRAGRQLPGGPAQGGADAGALGVACAAAWDAARAADASPPTSSGSRPPRRRSPRSRPPSTQRWSASACSAGSGSPGSTTRTCTGAGRSASPRRSAPRTSGRRRLGEAALRHRARLLLRRRADAAGAAGPGRAVLDEVLDAARRRDPVGGLGAGARRRPAGARLAGRAWSRRTTRALRAGRRPGGAGGDRRGVRPPRTDAGPTMVSASGCCPPCSRTAPPEQQERFVPPTLRGEIVWCQLFSEPGAGSDLAGLSTRAARSTVAGAHRPEGLELAGARGRLGVCLARTDPDAPKHRGLSYFLIDMRAPGVDVRPLRQATGLWSSTRSSSTTCSCPTTASSPGPVTAGSSPHHAVQRATEHGRHAGPRLGEPGQAADRRARRTRPAATRRSGCSAATPPGRCRWPR